MRSEQQLNELQRDLKTLRIEYEKYFNGALELPPSELDTRLRYIIRDLRTSLRSSADNFRLSSLEAQYNSYSELFRRRLREREEGSARRASAPAAPDPMSGVVVGANVGNEAAESIYSRLCQDSPETRRVSPERFQKYLNEHAAKIREKTGCQKVSFRLAQDNGKLRLKARPVR